MTYIHIPVMPPHAVSYRLRGEARFNAEKTGLKNKKRNLLLTILFLDMVNAWQIVNNP
jgi:hypothetical protein